MTLTLTPTQAAYHACMQCADDLCALWQRHMALPLVDLAVRDLRDDALGCIQHAQKVGASDPLLVLAETQIGVVLAQYGSDGVIENLDTAIRALGRTARQMRRVLA